MASCAVRAPMQEARLRAASPTPLDLEVSPRYRAPWRPHISHLSPCPSGSPDTPSTQHLPVSSGTQGHASATPCLTGPLPPCFSTLAFSLDTSAFEWPPSPTPLSSRSEVGQVSSRFCNDTSRPPPHPPPAQHTADPAQHPVPSLLSSWNTGPQIPP